MGFKAETLRILLGIFLSGFGITLFNIFQEISKIEDKINNNIVLIFYLLSFAFLILSIIITSVKLYKKGG
jgi:H+/Cl- antiporter ClcA